MALSSAAIAAIVPLAYAIRSSPPSISILRRKIPSISGCFNPMFSELNLPEKILIKRNMNNLYNMVN